MLWLSLRSKFIWKSRIIGNNTELFWNAFNTSQWWPTSTFLLHALKKYTSSSMYTLYSCSCNELLDEMNNFFRSMKEKIAVKCCKTCKAQSFFNWSDHFKHCGLISLFMKPTFSPIRVCITWSTRLAFTWNNEFISVQYDYCNKTKI